MTWLIYRDECPECKTEPKGEVVRQIFSRYDFCSKNCGILLLIPSWREPKQKVSAVCWQVGDEEKQKMTREDFDAFSAIVSAVAAKFGEEYAKLIYAIDAMRRDEMK